MRPIPHQSVLQVKEMHSTSTVRLDMISFIAFPDVRPPLVYHNPDSPAEVQHARELHERIRREFPELRIYRFFEKPIGPHTLAMFEVNTFTPVETGALFGFLTVWRGPLSYVPKPYISKPSPDTCPSIGCWCIQTLAMRSETTLSWRTGWAKQFLSIPVSFLDLS